MPTDPFNLHRFIEAQAHSYPGALSELQRGRKQSHWMWYILPQLQGLGHSQMSQRYGITSLEEAKAYAAHPVLGPRLVACVEAILVHQGQSAEAILGGVDAQKFRSCLTLFAQAAPGQARFVQALQQFFGGEPDAATLTMLRTAAPGR